MLNKVPAHALGRGGRQKLGVWGPVCVCASVRDKSVNQSSFYISTMESYEIITRYCVCALHYFLLQTNNTAMYFSLLSMFRFSLDRHTDLDRIFNIHSGNGSLYTSKPLDRELSQWHNLTVIAAEISKMNFMYIIFNIYQVLFHIKMISSH